MSNKKSGKDFVVVGLALFAMFFGAGNLIFPPDLGLKSGPHWWLGALCFIIADAGLAIVAVLAMIKKDGDLKHITGTIGDVPAKILNTAIIVCIGPLLAIPRTAATTFETGVMPILGWDEIPKVGMIVFSIIFFAIVLLLTIRPSKVVDIVGQFLTPVLVIALVVMIIVGMVNPAAPVGPEISQTVVKDGIYNGYQTMDPMASLFFAIIIITSIRDKGYTDKKDSTSVAIKASVLAGILLTLVYGGLAFLGATTGTKWTDGVLAGTINQAGLLINITRELLGQPGVILLGVVVALACLTTAIGLTSSAATYFSELTNGKVKYEVGVTVVSVFSAVVCNFGLSTIISIAAPILSLVYPLVILLVVLSYFTKSVRKSNVYKVSALIAFVVSLLTVLCDTFKMEGLSFIHSLPLDTYGFNWVVPAIVGIIIGFILPGKDIAEE